MNKKPEHNKKFVEICEQAKRQITKNYNLPFPKFDIEDFLVSEKEPGVLDEPSVSRVRYEHPNNTHHLGLYFNPELQNNIVENNPFEKLSLNNLNDYLILIEETSHLLMLCLHVEYNKKVRMVELEMQARLDKIINMFQLLKEQKTNENPETIIAAIQYLLVDKNYIVAEKEIYERYRLTHQTGKQAITTIDKWHKNPAPVLEGFFQAEFADKFRYFLKLDKRLLS